MQINIALGITNTWFKYAQVTVASVLFNASSDDEYSFYIMANEFTEQDKENFRFLEKIYPAKFNFITMDDSYFDGAIHDWLGVSSSYRLRLASLVEESKILYLDADAIAMDDIAKLYKTDVSEYYLAAIEDKMGKYMKTRIKLGEDETFYNGGVQLINLDRFREDNLEEIIFKELRNSLFYTDQDVINLVCREKILSLPLKYNLMPIVSGYSDRRMEFLYSLKHPVILHYTHKPWKNDNVFMGEHWHNYKNKLDELKMV